MVTEAGRETPSLELAVSNPSNVVMLEEAKVVTRLL
jgi:hypothetical protein